MAKALIIIAIGCALLGCTASSRCAVEAVRFTSGDHDVWFSRTDAWEMYRFFKDGREEHSLMRANGRCYAIVADEEQVYHTDCVLFGYWDKIRGASGTRI